jgi:hypothetical protein
MNPGYKLFASKVTGITLSRSLPHCLLHACGDGGNRKTFKESTHFIASTCPASSQGVSRVWSSIVESQQPRPGKLLHLSHSSSRISSSSRLCGSIPTVIRQESGCRYFLIRRMSGHQFANCVDSEHTWIWITIDF